MESVASRGEWQARPLEADRKRIPSQIERLVNAIADCPPAASLKEHLVDLEGRVSELAAKLAAAPIAAPGLHPELPRVYRQKVARLAEALTREGGQAAMEAIRELVDEIRLIPTDGDTPLRIEVRGELSAILNLRVAARESPSSSGSWRSPEVVAGRLRNTSG